MKLDLHVSDTQFLNAAVPDDTLLILSENGQTRELCFRELVREKGQSLDSTDQVMLKACLRYHGDYFAGSNMGWAAKVVSWPLPA